MTTIEYENGYRGTFDETLKPGDLITAYRRGYHEFVRYEERRERIPLIHYKTIYSFNGEKKRGKAIYTCDAAYCRRASEHILKSIEEKEKEIKLLKKILLES